VFARAYVHLYACVFLYLSLRVHVGVCVLYTVTHTQTVCMYVCLYVCMYVWCMYACMYVCILHAPHDIHTTRINIYIYTSYTYTYIYTYTYTYTQAYTFIHTYICLHMCTHTLSHSMCICILRWCMYVCTACAMDEAHAYRMCTYMRTWRVAHTLYTYMHTACAAWRTHLDVCTYTYTAFTRCIVRDVYALYTAMHVCIQCVRHAPHAVWTRNIYVCIHIQMCAPRGTCSMHVCVQCVHHAPCTYICTHWSRGTSRIEMRMPHRYA